ncbi:MAG: hypothetical protein AB7S74_14085 [Hyphomicrobium sp.]
MSSPAPKTRRSTLEYLGVVVLATVAPTLFVLSQNWYAVHMQKSLWLIGAALLAGISMGVLLEIIVRTADFALGRTRLSALSSNSGLRDTLFALAAAGIPSLLLFRSLEAALPSRAMLAALYGAMAIAIVLLFRRVTPRPFLTFFAIFSAVSAANWLASVATAEPPKADTLTQDFETAVFKSKPNIYLFIYDAYGSKDVYERIFSLDNSAQYAALQARGFKVLHSFSNYDSTWQTTLATFLGAHHYYRFEFGNADTHVGRPMMAGRTHNPVFITLQRNGYRLQQIHSLDYFVNERGNQEFIYPDEASSSALRIFNIPFLNKLGGRKRRMTVEGQSEVLDARIRVASEKSSGPWFTFSHVNLPAHSPGLPWLQLKGFERDFRERTARANEHMLATIDRIKTLDPTAVIAIFGDHGAMRYHQIWGAGDPNQAFAEAGVSPEIVTLDRFGIMIAINSAGLCDDQVYPGLTPVNIMRTIFACLADDRRIASHHADDISLFGGKKGRLRLTAENGRILPQWQVYEPK